MIRSLLKTKIEELYLQYKVSEKYQVCNIETLVLEGSLSKVNLSKSALDSLEAMVRRVKGIEDAVTIRELQLELKCSNAGLITPIELNEVQSFIEDENYDFILEDMINKRVEIQEQVKRNIELEQQRKEELLKQEEQRKQHLEEQKQQEELVKVQEKQKETGKKIVKLAAYFEVEVNADVADNKVWSKYVVELQKQFSTFVNLEVK